MIRGLALGALLALASCGGSTGAVLEIESSLAVPDEVDALAVRIAGAQHPQKDVSLTLTDPFPHSVAVVLDGVSGTVILTVSATKSGEVVTTTQITVEVAPGRMRTYRVTL